LPPHSSPLEPDHTHPYYGQVKPDEQFAQIWLRRFGREREMEVYAAELIQATWRLYMLQKKAPEEVTVEVQLYLDQLMQRHQRFRLEHAMQSGLSLDAAHDKAMSMSRKLQSLREDVEAMGTRQMEMLDVFEELDDPDVTPLQ